MGPMGPRGLGPTNKNGGKDQAERRTGRKEGPGGLPSNDGSEIWMHPNMQSNRKNTQKHDICQQLPSKQKWRGSV